MKQLSMAYNTIRNKTIYSFVAFLIAVPVVMAAGTVQVKGTVEYAAHGPTGSWTGTNKSVSGKVSLDPFSGTVCIDMKAWDSRNTRRDDHTRSMFEVDRYPQACYTITGVSGNTIQGQMEIHGVKKPLAVPGTLKITATGLSFEGDMTVGVEEYGMTRPVMMGMKVNNDVKVNIKVSGGI